MTLLDQLARPVWLAALQLTLPLALLLWATRRARRTSAAARHARSRAGRRA